MTGSILILTGAPGAGKSTVARLLADTSTRPTVHLHTDDFYAAIRKGFISPWLREAQQQNIVVVGVIVEAALGFARGGYDVIIDGIVGPWFLDPFREAAKNGVAFDYVVLRPNEAETIRRGSARNFEKALRDEAVIAQMWKAFSDLGPLESHALDSTAAPPDVTAEEIRSGIAAGRFRLS
jgi:chloramphenicol 3-O-phosphotransferase